MNNKGQGTVEYLIILAVIIVIALVVVAVMGWFPGLGTGITEKESLAYWQNASPLALKDWKITSTMTDNNFYLQNMTTDKIIVTEITIDGAVVGVGDATDDISVNAGSTGAFPGNSVLAVAPACTSGQSYQYTTVSISYNVVGGLQGKTLTGIKPLVGICP